MVVFHTNLDHSNLLIYIGDRNQPTRHHVVVYYRTVTCTYFMLNGQVGRSLYVCKMYVSNLSKVNSSISMFWCRPFCPSSSCDRQTVRPMGCVPRDTKSYIPSTGGKFAICICEFVIRSSRFPPARPL